MVSDKMCQTPQRLGKLEGFLEFSPFGHYMASQQQQQPSCPIRCLQSRLSQSTIADRLKKLGNQPDFSTCRGKPLVAALVLHFTQPDRLLSFPLLKGCLVRLQLLGCRKRSDVAGAICCWGISAHPRLPSFR